MAALYSVADFLDLLWRRMRLILLVAILGSALSLVLALMKEPIYTSTEVIQVNLPQIAGDLAKSTADGSFARRIQLVEQRLMARDTLLEVADKFGLREAFPGLRPNELVTVLRRSLSIRGTPAANSQTLGDGAISVLTITATMSSPEQAQALAREISDRTIRLSQSSRIEQARETLTFFSEKETTLIREIAKLEEDLAELRFQNDVMSPEEVQVRGAELIAINESLLTLAREEIELRQTTEEAAATQSGSYAQRVRDEYDAQMVALTAQRALLENRRAELQASMVMTPELDRQLTAVKQALERKKSELEVVTERRADAEVGFRMESALQGEQLNVIETASLPDYPSGKSRKSLALMGGVVSVVAGLALALLMDVLHPALRSAGQMQRETGLMPVVSIPVLDTRPRGIRARLHALFRRGRGSP
ncbi:Wzz/FepE/Etk N-terminal domain-containing protein [Phaeobacter sp. HF9A]|uniref:Wzz/FepE/Etk N-terminal domain-containing protein n=1 Tax=Phaeobacter sp. HF9A TaxID=2721561 RepID=UPI0014311C14|nr:Wzz/FepE/Etk N-terminal domain-containing protein [Phaeobacter sp. HF9A]NIZ15692.1 DUF874 domain-containing protein [Phaeobacter sp. HF9A]